MTFGENFERAKNGQYYTKDNLPAFLSAVGTLELCGGKIKYYNVPASFDIETTSFRFGEMPCGTMYCFSFCLNGAVYFGRTYNDLLLLTDTLTDYFNLSDTRRLRVYDRNLGFEFQFIRHWFNFIDVFARQPREPMRARTDSGIEFSCSQVLTNQSLKATAKDLIEYKIEKLSGELDYRQLRHSETPMTEREIQYSLNDVLIDASLINDRIKSDGNIARIPLTATGYTRRLCRNACLPHRDKRRWNYARNIARLMLTVPEYLCALQAFAGGYCHASPLSVGTPIEYVASVDWTSAYPAAMVCEKEYPVSKGIEIDPRKIVSRETLIQKARDFAFIGSFEFYDIDSKTDVDYYISKSKTHNARGIEEFNGRIASAEFIQICLTHLDFLTILENYNIGKIRVLRLWQYRKGYLPKEIIETVLLQYGKKTKLKDVAGMEAEYLNGKRDTNCIYGMLVTQLNRPEVEYNAETGHWDVVPVKTADVIEKYNNDQNRFISYLWGIMVTAICRRNLWKMINECGTDYHYSDTDSGKITNFCRHKEYFHNYNKEIDRKMQEAAEAVGFDFELTRPETIKGKKKPLGQWDFEGVYTKAKFLNAKRYIYIKDNELHVTIAGTGKESTAKWLMAKYKTFDAVFDAFDDGLTIDGELRDEDDEIIGGTGKLTHVYNDEEFTVELTDYTGRTAVCHEKSSVYLEPCNYAIGFTGAFLDFLHKLNNKLVATQYIPI